MKVFVEVLHLMQSYNTGKPLVREICCALSYGILYTMKNIIPKWWPDVTESPRGMVFTKQCIQLLRMQQNTFHESVACHLDVSAPGPRFGLFFNYSKHTQRHQYSRYISGAALEIPVSVNNDITMSAIESDSYMTVHALFQFNEAAYCLTRLVVD